MFTWFKRLLGIAPASEPLVLDNPVVQPKAEPVKEKPLGKTTATKTKKATTAKPKKTTKKAAPKKKVAVNLDGMSKADLLAHAKANGIKANASLKKDEILERIKSAG